MALFTCQLLKLLQFFQRNGVEGKSLCMLGKPTLPINPQEFFKIAERCHCCFNMEKRKIFEKSTWEEIDAYDFFGAFGFSEVHAIDVSEYEGADLIYDLNLPLPELLNEQFDYVVDNGTLEHVFCATEAVKNAARICKKGGWIVNVTPAAGYTNHGFYSFSPRFYNDFYENNGFWIDEIQFEFLFDGEGLPNWQMISSQDCRLFSSTDWKRMEDYIDRVRKVDGIGRVLMWVTAQRKEIKGVQFGNPQQAFDNEPEDETVVQRKSYRLETVIEFIKEQEQCILYCAGEVCKQILHAIYDNNLESKILYILDKDFNKTGTRLKNFEVRYPNNASIGCGKPILICSDVYDQEIYDEICTKYPNSKNDLIKICDLM